MRTNPSLSLNGKIGQAGFLKETGPDKQMKMLSNFISKTLLTGIGRQRNQGIKEKRSDRGLANSQIPAEARTTTWYSEKTIRTQKRSAIRQCLPTFYRNENRSGIVGTGLPLSF
jgi:hypothetical protein